MPLTLTPSCDEAGVPARPASMQGASTKRPTCLDGLYLIAATTLVLGLMMLANAASGLSPLFR